MLTSTYNHENLCRQVEDAVSILNELLATLVRSSQERSAGRHDTAPPHNLGWLRPLAAKIVELEYTVRRRSRVDVDGVRATCEELVGLLEALGGADRAFSARYAQERTECVEASRLHGRACAACRELRRCGSYGVLS
jgi:hypothetical protein